MKTRKTLLIAIIALFSLPALGQTLDKMAVEELEAYLTPPMGTERKDVESFYGFAFEESEKKDADNIKVTGYSLFYPVYLEVIYEKGKVAKAGMHHEVNLNEWNSELQFEIKLARKKAPEKIDQWLKQGYLHYVQGRNLLRGVQFPAWHQPPTQESEQSGTGQPATRPVELPANLVQVVSGGDWKDGEKHGFVRLSVFDNGFEQLNQQIVIEWIQHPTNPNDKAAVVSRVVVKEGPLAWPVWSFGRASFSIKEGKTSINFEATNTREQDKRAEFSIEILGFGKVDITQGEQDGGGQPATRPESK